MKNHTPYRDKIEKLRRIAQIIPNLNNIIFEPRSDGRSFNMLWHVQSMNENVPFGVMAIPKDFIAFLKSGAAPKTAWGPEKAYWFLSDHVLDIDRQTSAKEYGAISNNLKMLQAGDKNQINNFLMTGYPGAVLNTVVDTDVRTRNNEHNQFVNSYIQWKRGQAGQSVAQPVMAKRDKSLRIISSRKKREKK